MTNMNYMFPSPTGVNYYEQRKGKRKEKKEHDKFPSPTGVNYYELIVCQNSIST